MIQNPHYYTTYNDCLFYLAGDFNARTKNLLDYIPDDNLHYIFGDIDHNSDYFNLPHLNKDKKFNAFGKSLVEMCCNFDVHILNGRLFKDREGHITCTSSGGCSVVDYNIASSDLFQFGTDFEILDKHESDHFPLKCTLKIHSNQLHFNTRFKSSRDFIP